MIHPKLERGLAGLQAGMFGGIALLAVMMMVSLLDRRSWYSYPNLLGAWFYGGRSLGGGVGWPAMSGIALQLLIASCGGALFAAVFASIAGTRRIVLLGLMWGILVFYGSDQFYRFTSPVVAAYLPRGASVVAHMIYGVCLAGIGRIGGPPADIRQTPGVAAMDRELSTPPQAAPALTDSVETERMTAAPEELPHDGTSIAKPAREGAGPAA